MRYLAALTTACTLAFCALPAMAVEELSWGDLVPANARGLDGMPLPSHDLSTLADTLSNEDFGDPAVQLERATRLPTPAWNHTAINFLSSIAD